MKIGIITVQKAPNYGAVLQCYALQRYFLKENIDCEVIDLYRPFHPEFKHTKGYTPYKYRNLSVLQKIRMYLRKNKNKYFYFLNDFLREERKFRTQHKAEYDRWNKGFDKFNSRIKFSEAYHSIGQLYSTPPFYDVYITGSDQLWNPTQNYCIEPFFLTFVKNGGKRISYATSIGQTELPKYVKEDYKKWIKGYDAISLRESSAIKLMQGICDKKIERTIDPTMLITKDEWEQVVKIPNIEEDYVFFFTLNHQKDLFEYAIKYAEKYDLTLIYWIHDFRDANCAYNKAEGKIDISPEEWLGYIKKAHCVITDSFHGSVFSIIFETQFNTYISPDSTRGSRITDLFQLLNVNDRLLTNLSSIKEIENKSFCNVNNIIDTERRRSINFLNSSIY